MGHRERARNAFYRVEFKCLLIVVICRFGFDEDGREVVVKGGSRRDPRGTYPFRLGGDFCDGLFVYFMNILIIGG